jgi:transposase
MKRDGRKLPHATLEEMRLTALERMKQGETPSEVATAFGLHRSWAYKVLTKARGRGRGKRALLSSKGTGRPRKLTTAREWQIFKWLNGKSPYQHGLGFTLWSRQSVGDLIERKWGIHLSLASIGGLLIHLGLRPRKPLWWIGDEAPEAMTRWRAEIYPEIMRKARRENAELCFWEESDFRVDTVRGRTNAGATGARTASMRPSGFGGEQQGRLLACRPQRRRRPERRIAREPVAPDNEGSPQASAPGARRPARAQEPGRA